MWNREKAVREELGKSGIEDVFKARVRSKIQLVIDSDPEEWVLGFPPTHDIFWHVVFPE